MPVAFVLEGRMSESHRPGHPPLSEIVVSDSALLSITVA